MPTRATRTWWWRACASTPRAVGRRARAGASSSARAAATWRGTQAVCSGSGYGDRGGVHDEGAAARGLDRVEAEVGAVHQLLEGLGPVPDRHAGGEGLVGRGELAQALHRRLA